MAILQPDLSHGGPLGQPVDRIEGRLKVAGAAKYAYENGEIGRTAYGFVRGAEVARGRIASIDTSAAEAAPGVLLVMTHLNAPAQPDFGGRLPPEGRTGTTRPRPVLSSPEIRYFDQPVALVVAESFEAARSAAHLVAVEYAPAEGDFELESRLDEAYDPENINAGYKADSVLGDPQAAISTAPVQIDAVYHNDFEHHAAMEPHAALAAWEGDTVTIHYSGQGVQAARTTVAATLGMSADKVRMLTPYVGGGFGSKIVTHFEPVLAAFAARAIGRPVKLAQTRQQLFANAGHRPAMHQHIRLGALNDGRLAGFEYDVTMTSARMEEFAEQTAVFARALYAAPHRATRHRLVPVDIWRAEFMRAPGEAPGLLAFESAMDELAVALDMDPVALRLVNEPERDPERDVPFSTRRLVECLEEGAARFGWQARAAQPRSRREGRKLIGQGMAAGIRPNYLRTSAARVRMERNGRAVVETDMTDIGNGSYTVIAQVAAEELGLSVADIEVRLGDSLYPVSTGSGGSFGASSSGAAVTDACRTLRRQIQDAVRAADGSPFRGVNDAELVFENRSVRGGGVTAPIETVVAGLANDQLVAEGKIETVPTYKEFSQHSYGAFFVEVAVDEDTAEIRVRRMLGVFDAGRLLNAKLARSQLIGGMIWGVGAALLESSELDPRYGAFVNCDLANYHVMSHADVPDIEALFLDARDDKANPMGSKGLGELGICGSGAAVANAVYDATGVRVRHFPITVDRLLAGGV